MDDLDKFIKDSEATVNRVRKAIAEYEASGDNLDRLRRETAREIDRFEKLRGNDKVGLDDAVDLFMEAGELKLAVYEGVGEIGDAVEDLLTTDLDELMDFDPLDVENYPPELRDTFDELSEDEQKKALAEIAEVQKELAADADAKPKAKKRDKRMSV